MYMYDLYINTINLTVWVESVANITGPWILTDMFFSFTLVQGSCSTVS